ncbi:MAG: MFS transporter [Actinomycetota bacterium]|nr:MFS transporter [Actinomycetota bacterium]
MRSRHRPALTEPTALAPGDAGLDGDRSGADGPGGRAMRAVYRSVDGERRSPGAEAYRGRVLILFFFVLGLDHADRAAVGALAPVLKRVFGITNLQVGLLAAAVSLVGALATVPVGILADRARRMRLLAVGVGAWTVAMALAGAATSFAMLLGARVLLGAVTATARPTTSSMVGDLYPVERRGRALGVIQSGMLIGTATGFLIGGVIGAALSWRYAFWALAVAGVALAAAFWRLPEPPRTGAGRAPPPPPDGTAEPRPRARPDPRLVLEGDVARLPLWNAVRYVLSIRTNVVVIIATSVGTFFFVGVETFGVLFAVHQYRLTTLTADLGVPLLGLGALVGVIAGGRLGDALQRRGVASGRLITAALGYSVGGILLLPAGMTHSLLLASPLLVLGAAGVSAANPVLDAVRLDVVHPQLRGRAEAVRNVVDAGAGVLAPLVFGVLSANLGGGGAEGLRLTFFVMLPALVANGLLLLLAIPHYPTDAASAEACASR